MLSKSFWEHKIWTIPQQILIGLIYCCYWTFDKQIRIVFQSYDGKSSGGMKSSHNYNVLDRFGLLEKIYLVIFLSPSQFYDHPIIIPHSINANIPPHSSSPWQPWPKIPTQQSSTHQKKSFPSNLTIWEAMKFGIIEYHGSSLGVAFNAIYLNNLFNHTVFSTKLR